MTKNQRMSVRPGIWLGIVWTFILLLCVVNNSFAQQEYSLKTVPNVRLQDGRNHVSNPDSILSVAYVDSINRVLNVMEDSTGIEVAVVAITSVGDNDTRLFASDLFNHWGIGKKGKDNGLLIMLVTKPEQRTVVFETGYGLEGDMPDATCYSIQQKYMLPDMKQGNYDVGMLKGVQAVSDLLYGGKGTGATDSSDEEFTFGEILLFILLLLIVGAIIIFIVYVIPIFFINLFVGVAGISLTKIWPKKCPECGKRRMKLERVEVVEKTTFKKNGLNQLHYKCKHCGHEEVVKDVMNKYGLFCFINRYLPNRYRDLSDGGNSGSDDSGSDWGGGSSGGGGASSDF